MNEKIIKILFRWGLQDSEIKQIYNTAWQVGNDYVLKIYQNLEMLERNLRMLRILDEMNIPVGKIVPTNNNQSYAAVDDVYCFLSKKLSGSSIMQIDDVENTASHMGEIIANLHIAFKKCEDIDVFWDNSLLDEMNGWVKKNLEDSRWNYVSKEEYEKTVTQLGDVYDNLPVQLIHRDVHFGNFLFDNGEFSGYIDFDLSQKNIRIFDLCYFVLGLLSEDGKLQITEEQWFEFVKHVFAGYEKKLKLSEPEKKAVPYVMECIELLFVSYFESINNVSDAEDAYKIFKFVKDKESRIWKIIR